MPRPLNATAASLVRQDLDALFEPYDTVAMRSRFIGLQVLPPFETAQAYGVFGKVALNALLENRETRRAPRSGYSRSDWEFTSDSFQTYEDGAEEVIDQNEAAIYGSAFQFEKISAERARLAVLLGQEKRIADLLFNATTFSGKTAAVTNEWDDYANATPITDVETAARAVWTQSGLWPNALIINRHVFRNLRMCAQVISRMESGGAGTSAMATDVGVEQLKRIFDLDYILVGDGVRNTAAKGATATLGKIWSDEYALVARIATSNDLAEPVLGRTFHWGGDGSVLGGVTEEYTEPQTRSNIIRVRQQVGEKLMYVEAGYLLSNITT